MANIVTGKTALIGAVLAVALFCLRKYTRGGVCNDTTRLDGKLVLITGANTGIGKETALDLARRGARVVMACRSVTRGQNAADDIHKQIGNKAKLEVMELDLSSLKSIRTFSEQFLQKEKKLDILINNAGVMMTPYTKTVDGFELLFGVNHLGHFLLTNLLLDIIKAAAPSRIINVSSSGHRFGTIDFEDLMFERRKYDYLGLEAYGQSKLANILFSLELTKRLQGTRVTANSLHPGGVVTELSRHSTFLNSTIGKILFAPIAWTILKGPPEGAQTTICCAVQQELESVSGKYYSDCVEKTPMPAAQDETVARRLWEISERLVGIAA